MPRFHHNLQARSHGNGGDFPQCLGVTRENYPTTGPQGFERGTVVAEFGRVWAMAAIPKATTPSTRAVP